MSGRTEAITLTDGREIPLPPFTFGELDDWFAIDDEMQAAIAATDGRAQWACIRRQVALVHAAIERGHPGLLTLRELQGGLIYRDLEHELWRVMREVNRLSPANPTIVPEDQAA